MKCYFDSSALVKRYVEEEGSSHVARLMAAPGTLMATSRVAHAEILAALARRVREGSLDDASFDAIVGQLERDMDALLVIDVTELVVRRCTSLVRSHPLRGFDAIHLASAVILAGPFVDRWSFVCADERLLLAATDEGFEGILPGA